MTCCALMLCVALAQPELTVEIPDTVGIGEQFAVTIRCSDPACEGLSSTTAGSAGIAFVTSRSMRSFSSSSVNGVSTVSADCTLMMVFQATAPGVQWVGPLRVDAGYGGLILLPADTVFVSGGETRPGAPVRQGAWIDAVPSEDPLWPGVPSRVDYYLNTQSLIKGIEATWTPPSNGVARFVETPSTTSWRLIGDGTRRARVLTLEVVPAGPGTMMLPVVDLRVSEYHFPFSRSGGVRDVRGDSTFVGVAPFPDSARPPGFTGIADSLCLVLQAGNPSCGRDRNARLTATGPGAAMTGTLPAITVHGPAALLEAGSGGDEGERWWDLVISPTDSGTVVLGPDSVPWFDRESRTYRQAFIEPCTLLVAGRPELCDSAILAENDVHRDRSMLALLALVPALLVGTLFLYKWHAARRRRLETSEAQDPEELLTAFELGLASMLTGRPRPIGADGLEEALVALCVPQILQRRLLRHWKDLEQMMACSGHESRATDLEAAKRLCSELFEQLEKALQEAGRM